MNLLLRVTLTFGAFVFMLVVRVTGKKTRDDERNSRMFFYPTLFYAFVSIAMFFVMYTQWHSSSNKGVNERLNQMSESESGATGGHGYPPSDGSWYPQPQQSD